MHLIFNNFNLSGSRILQYLEGNWELLVNCMESLRERFSNFTITPQMLPRGPRDDSLWDFESLWQSLGVPSCPKEPPRAPKRTPREPYIVFSKPSLDWKCWFFKIRAPVEAQSRFWRVGGSKRRYKQKNDIELTTRTTKRASTTFDAVWPGLYGHPVSTVWSPEALGPPLFARLDKG